ncbi:hypothetical protein HBI25_177330 [Parastagonospora nodorum]|nr:hypothetical protein HBI80_222770 [Parastagonospora nodorum]KAH4897799.1 hypothetical protein HBH74_189720 [Parastagonospora nodorum]KAH4982806.1 hypothetical protein HBH73_033250 [Parastagonospora nodorum]KAH5513812.1 hypothetical protein HBI31_014320 [Parastagonospora nodorum]KAH5552923.1 hypothetical protein HBI25_177330 [Parastagonospora nodorum]
MRSYSRSKKVEEDASEAHVDDDVHNEHGNRRLCFNAKVATNTLRSHINDGTDTAVDDDWDEHEDDHGKTCEVDFVMLSPYERCSYNVDAFHEEQKYGGLGKCIESKAHPRPNETEIVCCEALTCYKHCGCEYERQY